MWVLMLLTYFAIFVQLCFVTIAIAAGLYYLAEMVEEYSVITRKIIYWTNTGVLSLFLLLWLFEGFPNWLTLCGILSQINNYLILQNFPFIAFTSPTFIVAVTFIVINHYLAFQYFGSVYYSFSEVMAYFTLCQWVVPFALFVSLSANDNVLPTTTTKMDGDVVTNYFSKKGKKYGLLSLFNYAKTSILPTQQKKGF